jgi:hypothetical protein
MHPQQNEPLVSLPPARRRWRYPVLLGSILGAVFGLWNLVATRLNPLADDDLVPLLVFYGPMFTIWGIAGFGAARRTGRLSDAVTVGATVAFVTFLVYDLAVILRVNLFLDAMSQRSDWQNLMEGFKASGFKSLRAYANYRYVTGTPFKILVATMIGAATGLVGGLFGKLGHRGPIRIHNSEGPVSS